MVESNPENIRETTTNNNNNNLFSIIVLEQIYLAKKLLQTGIESVSLGL